MKARYDRFLYRITNLVVNAVYYKLFGSTVGEVLASTARRQPDKTMFVYLDGSGGAAQKRTFGQVDKYANRAANYFEETAGASKGDVMALCLENRADYTGLWIGLSRLGCVSALINTHIRDRSLVHTLSVVKARFVVFSNDTEPNVGEVVGDLDADVRFYKLDPEPVDEARYPELSARTTLASEGIASASASPVEGKRAGLDDTAVYIFTSGTTGLPKAVPLKHSRYLLMTGGLDMCGVRRDDVVYTCLPLYHTAANGIVVGGSIARGKRTEKYVCATG